MAPEAIVGIAVAAAVVFGLAAKLLSMRRPRSPFFKCSRCNTTSRHSNRTIEAWRNNKTTFYCQACHAKWLEAQRPRVREQFPSRGETPSGCLGVVALFALVPLVGLLAWAYT